MSEIRGTIEATRCEIGRGVVIEEGAKIIADDVVIGDYAYIGRDVYANVPRLVVGDYTKIHNNSVLHGYKPLQIGRQCWFGPRVVLDSIGGLDIDNYVGIGAASQVWTHIRFGDVVQGNNYNSAKYMYIPEDVWFVGMCLVSPVVIGARSMAMLGSVIVKDMHEDAVYGGSPARDVSDKLPRQFARLTDEDKMRLMAEDVADFERVYPEFANCIQVRRSSDEFADDGRCYFSPVERVYVKRHHPAEVAYLKWTLAKFRPVGEPARVFDLQQKPERVPVLGV